MDQAREIDPLTGFYTKAAFEHRFKEEISWAERTRQPITIAFIDLDDFGRINKPPYSQFHGDAALNQFGEHVRKAKRDTDIAGRIGGEESVLVMPGTAELGAKQLLKRITEQLPGILEEGMHEMGYGLNTDDLITASVGIFELTMPPYRPIDNELLMQEAILNANLRMQIAKRAGKNRVIGTVEEQTFMTQPDKT